jgi:hypothetical protein
MTEKQGIKEPKKFTWGSGDLTWTPDPHVLPDENEDRENSSGKD